MPVLIRIGCRLLKTNVPYVVKFSGQHRCLSSALTRNDRNMNLLTPLQHLNAHTRDLSSHEITKNIQLISNDKIKVNKGSKDFKLPQPLERPVVVMLTWLMAQQKHIMKFAKLYSDQGFDVLNVAISPWQLLWPTKGVQLVSRDVVKFLQNNGTSNPILLHGFSVGGYVWGECLVHMSQNLQMYEPLVQRIVGQVWDSAADITEIPVGVPKAVFPNNKVLQTALRKYMLYHMKTFHVNATIHYIRASQMFHSTLVKTPALLFLSKTDPIGAESSNQRLRESYEGIGIKCYWKCWDRSPHVGHYQKHPEEYTQELFSFLESIGLTNQQQKLRIKI